MRRIAFISRALGLTVVLAGCATAPPREGGVPATSKATLRLCEGMRIANAPATDAYRAVVAYTPTLDVRGVALLRAPADGCLSSAFGPRRSSAGAGAFHDGVDLFTRAPAPILAAGNGRVVQARSLRGYGLTVDVDHGAGVMTRYAHLSETASQIRKGARVRANDIIGKTGKSGNATAVHLHYEIRVDGRPINPLATKRAGV